MHPPQTEMYRIALEHMIEDETFHGLTIDAIVPIKGTRHIVISFTSGKWAIIKGIEDEYRDDGDDVTLLDAHSLQYLHTGSPEAFLNALWDAGILSEVARDAELRMQTQINEEKHRKWEQERAATRHRSVVRELVSHEVLIKAPSIYGLLSADQIEVTRGCQEGHACPREPKWIKWNPGCPVCRGSDCGDSWDGTYMLICDEHRRLEGKGSFSGQCVIEPLRPGS